MNINNKFLSIVGAMTVAIGMVSCTDKQDWNTDSTYDRLFGVNESLTITPEDTKAYVEFTKVPNATYYIIEVSLDSLYDDVAMGGSRAIVFGQDKSITKADTIRGLMGDSQYYLRVKSMSDTKESNWVYYKTGSGRGYFKTKAEQIFNGVTEADRSEDAIKLSWTFGAEVTSIAVYKGSELADSIVLDASAIAAAEYTVTGLKPSTTYKFMIYNGTSKRGELSVATTAAMPAGDYKIYLPSNTIALTQAMLDEVAAKAEDEGKTVYSVTFGIPAGLTIDVTGFSEEGTAQSIQIPDGMAITFFGLAGGDAPLLKISKAIDIRGNHGYIRFNNVSITDGGCQYLINQSEECTIGELSFTDVTVSDLSRSLVRLQGSSTKNIEKITLDNCIVANQGSGAYPLLYFNNKAYSVGTVEIKNSTFNTLIHSFIDCRNAIMNDINIDACTFYNIIGAGRYFIDAQKLTVPISLKNSIFALTNSDTSKGIREGVVSSTNSYMTSDFVLSGNTFTTDQTFEGAAGDLFVDPANGDFTLKKSFKAGDPRWWMTED